MSDRDRDLLELAYRHGLTGPDVAVVLGVSHDSVRTLLRRLRDAIERSLGALLVARRAAQIGVWSSPRPCPAGTDSSPS